MPATHQETTKTSFEILLDLFNPNTEIGKKFLAEQQNQAVKDYLNNQYLLEIAIIAWRKQEEEKKAFLRELEQNAQKEKEFWEKLQAQYNDAIEKSAQDKMKEPETEKLTQEINVLWIQKAGLQITYQKLINEQIKLHKTWEDLYQTHARGVIDSWKKGLTANTFTTPDGNKIELTDKKLQQLKTALIPVFPDLVFKVNEGLTAQLEQLQGKDERLQIFKRLQKTNDVLGELRFNASMGGDENADLLVGAALLKAIKQTKELERKTNTGTPLFSSTDPEPVCKTIEECYQNTQAIKENRQQFESVGKALEEKLDSLEKLKKEYRTGGMHP